MQVPLVMTVIGPDRPGLVEMLATLVADHGGNWLESRMCHLAGQFAGILRIHVPADRQQALEKTLDDLAARGLNVTVRAGRPTAESQPPPLLKAEIVGQDRPGIVREIARALARRGANVEELHTECSSAPMSGESLFHATAKVRLPEGCASAELRQELEKIADDLMVDLTIAEIRPGA